MRRYLSRDRLYICVDTLGESVAYLWQEKYGFKFVRFSLFGAFEAL